MMWSHKTSFLFTMTLVWLFLIGDDNFLINALRCLGVLLTTRKSKKADGDIPFLVRFVPVCIYN